MANYRESIGSGLEPTDLVTESSSTGLHRSEFQGCPYRFSGGGGIWRTEKDDSEGIEDEG
ncbi:hypothetical protein U1Q18_039609, partial [Sarracenia purpurea var. burkii]